MSFRNFSHGQSPTRMCSGATTLLALLVLVVGLTSTGLSQGRPYHYFFSADMPPGAVGQGQLLRGGPLAYHFQPVEISAPAGTAIALAFDGAFGPDQEAPACVGLLPGRVYRLKVTNIPFQPGQEVYPSIEIINRLYAPTESAYRFPIPIQLTREELELALNGQYVIRVIYLENPKTALPHREDPENQRYFEVGPSQDPLEVADHLGRPMAILRLGSRVPEINQVTGTFLFDSPPWIPLPRATDTPTEAVEPNLESTPKAEPNTNDTAVDTVRRTSAATAQRPTAGGGATR